MNLCFRDSYPPTQVVNPAWLHSPSRRLLSTIYAYFRKINRTGEAQEAYTRQEFHTAMRLHLEEKEVYSTEDGNNSTTIWVTQPSRQYVEAKKGLALVIRFSNAHDVVATRNRGPRAAMAPPPDTGLDPMVDISVTQLHHPLLSTVSDPYSTLLCSHLGTSTRRLFPILFGKIILHIMVQALLKDGVVPKEVGYSKAMVQKVLSHPIGLGLQVRHLFSSDDKASMALKNHNVNFQWRLINHDQRFNLDSIVTRKGCRSVWKKILDGMLPPVFTAACQELAQGRPLGDEMRSHLETYEGVSCIDPTVDDAIDLGALGDCYETVLERTFESTKMTAKFVTMMAQTRIEYVKVALPLYQSMSESTGEEQFRRLYRFAEWFTDLRPTFKPKFAELTMTGNNNISKDQKIRDRATLT